MVKFVIKSNGQKMPFDESKTKRSIGAAAREAGLSEDEALSLANEVTEFVLNSFGDQDTVSSMDIKTKILERLDANNPEVSSAWRDYDKTCGR